LLNRPQVRDQHKLEKASQLIKEDPNTLLPRTNFKQQVWAGQKSLAGIKNK
jgi:hypothetical protein